MAHKKQRVAEHIMEDQSLRIVRDILPKEWVVRDYKPDYGIDIAVELFERRGESGSTETMGEWFFAQVKSVKRTTIHKHKVYPRYNVEKMPLEEHKADSFEIDVIPFRMDTSELLTIQSFGSGIPVLLLLVTLDTRTLYFVCLNDIIDKYILPRDENFSDKKTKTIHIPVQNLISTEENSLVPIRFLAKRPKLYSAFAKFTYQEHEIGHLINRFSTPPTGGGFELPAIDTVRHFLKIIKRYDFWNTTDMWQIISYLYARIIKIEQLLNGVKDIGQLSADESPELGLYLIIQECHLTWSQLKNLNNIYEECCREWFLPTYLAQLSSYENTPNVFTEENRIGDPPG